MRYFLALVLITAFKIVNAQEKKPVDFVEHFTAGYVGSMPNYPAGFSVGFGKKIGFYIDAKFSSGDDIKGKDYAGTISTQHASSGFGDQFLGEKKDGGLLVNFAVSHVFLDRFRGYAGAGFIQNRYYHQYFDQSYILSVDGYYHMEVKSETSPTFILGAMYAVTDYFYIQAGLNYIDSPNIDLGLGFNLF